MAYLNPGSATVIIDIPRKDLRRRQPRSCRALEMKRLLRLQNVILQPMRLHLSEKLHLQEAIVCHCCMTIAAGCLFQRDRQWPSEWLQADAVSSRRSESKLQNNHSKVTPNRACEVRGNMSRESVMGHGDMSIQSCLDDDMDDDASPRSALAFDEGVGQQAVNWKGKFKGDEAFKVSNSSHYSQIGKLQPFRADFCNVEFDGHYQPESYRSSTSRSIFDDITRKAYSQETAYFHDYHEEDDDDDSFPMECLLAAAAHFEDTEYDEEPMRQEGRRSAPGVFRRDKSQQRRHSSDSYELRRSNDPKVKCSSRNNATSATGRRGRSPKKDKKKKKKKKGLFRRRLSLDSRMSEAKEEKGSDQTPRHSDSKKKRKQRRRSLPTSLEAMKQMVMAPAKTIVKRTRKRSKTPDKRVKQ